MRAKKARLAVMVLLSVSVCGCQSGGGMFAWFNRKKPSESAIANGPPVSTGTPMMPSSGQNPNSSLTSVNNTNSWGSGAAGAKPTSTAAASYGATPAAYQNPAYPTTPYAQAKVGATASNAANPWSGASANPGPAVGYGAAGAQPAGYAAQPPATAYPSATSAATPGYGAASMTPAANYVSNTPAQGVQPQNGFYNPTYDGGAANRYATGAPIPGTNPGAASPAYPSSGSPAAPVNNYRVADARGAAATPYASADTGANAAAGTMVGDRYSSSAASAPAATDRYAAPAADYRSSPTGYDAGAASYQPAAAPAGNYGAPAASPTDGSSSIPARAEPNYRPGGTSNYSAPAGGAAQPAPAGQSGSWGVTPASYQSSATSTPRATLASSASPADAGSEVYGSYQGGSATGEVAAAPSGTTPALLPNRSW